MKPALVLKDFPYAHDGVHTKTLTKGTVFDCQDDLFEGLRKDGYIKADTTQADAEAKAAATAAAQAKLDAKIRAIIVPGDWDKLADADKIALAARIAGTQPADATVAAAIIADELTKRV